MRGIRATRVRPITAITRRLGGILLVVTLVVAATMVGGRQTTSAQGRLRAHERAGLAGTTIRLGVWADQYEIKFYRQLVAPFEKQTGAKVKIEYTDYTTYWTKLPTQLAANTAPDVVLSNNNLSLPQQSHVFANDSSYLPSSHLPLIDYLRDPFRLYTYQRGLSVIPVR